MRLATNSLEALRRAVCAALALALVLQAAQLSVRLWSLAREPATPRRDRGAEAAAAGPRRSREAVQDVLEAHLFGRPPEPVAADSPADAAQWALSGTIEGPTPESGSAIIGRSGAPAHLRSAGARLPGDFTLAQVFADRVTIERGGQWLTVRFPRTLAGPTVRVAAREPVDAASARTSRAAGERPPIPAPLNQPPAMLVLRPAPHIGENGYDGMRIQGAGNGHALDAYGLRRNDVIKEVNGRPINNPEAARKALETLSADDPVSVTVERDGALFSLRLAAVSPGT